MGIIHGIWISNIIRIGRVVFDETGLKARISSKELHSYLSSFKWEKVSQNYLNKLDILKWPIIMKLGHLKQSVDLRDYYNNYEISFYYCFYLQINEDISSLFLN